MGLRDIGASLPPGFRFYPSDEELVCHYLYKKIANEDVLKGTLVEIDLHTCEPWQLPDTAKLNSSEWYFFSFRDRKYATGFRTNRATTSGYWKATGKDRTVVDPKSGVTVGMRKTLVFYKNRAPNGVKTGWIMHEFRLENPNIPPKEDWVLCRVFYKAKGDNSIENSPQNIMYHNTPHNPTPPNLDPSPTLITTFCPQPPCLHHHRPPIATTTNTISTALSDKNPPLHTHHHPPQNPFGNHQNLLQVPQDSTLIESTDVQMIITSNDKCEDQYGFLYDLGFEDNVPSHNLHDMEYEDDDNGVVFFE